MVELAIRDLKAEGLAHCPSGRFGANGAWALIAALAHNLVRWLAALGLGVGGPVVAKTIRARYLALAGRLVRSGRRTRLRLPARWPWAAQFTTALWRLRVVVLTT